MKTLIKDSFEEKVPQVTYNPSLDKYEGKVLFPEKLKLANQLLKNAKLPPNRNKK